MQCTITQSIIYSQSHNINASLFINLTSLKNMIGPNLYVHNTMFTIILIAIIVDYGLGYGYHLDDFLEPIRGLDYTAVRCRYQSANLPLAHAITESSRLSFVHVLVAVRDCQVDSITNRAMPCRLSSVDFDHGFLSWIFIMDFDHGFRSRILIMDVDHRSSMSSIDIEYRTQFWYGTVSNKLWMVST